MDSFTYDLINKTFFSFGVLMTDDIDAKINGLLEFLEKPFTDRALKSVYGYDLLESVCISLNFIDRGFNITEQGRLFKESNKALC